MTNKLSGRKGLVAAILVGTTMLSAPVQASDVKLVIGGALVASVANYSKEIMNLVETLGLKKVISINKIDKIRSIVDVAQPIVTVIGCAIVAAGVLSIVFDNDKKKVQ